MTLDRQIQRFASHVGTPFYLYDVQAIRRNLRRIRDAFAAAYSHVDIAYSAKNCVIPAIIKVIEEFKPRYEVTSLGEMMLLARMGISPARCIYTNIYKPPDAIEYAMRHGPALLAVDSLCDLQRVSECAARLRVRVPILVRVNPAIQMSDTVFASAVPWSKTGVQLAPNCSEGAIQVLEEAASDDWLEVVGLHAHLGSQVTNLEYFERFSASVIHAFHEFERVYELSILDFGGGYPCTYDPSIQVPTVEAIAQAVVRDLGNGRTTPRLIVETGRYVTGTAGSLVSRVVAVKQNPCVGRIAVVDASMYNHLLDAVLVHWYFSARILCSDKPLESTHIVGCTNDALDHLDPPVPGTCETCGHPEAPQRIRHLPRVETGDLVVIEGAGAYTTCFNSHYCLLPKPPVAILLESGGIEIAQRGETVEEVVEGILQGDTGV